MNMYQNPYSQQIGQGLYICPYMGYSQQSMDPRPSCITAAAAELRHMLHMLWVQHVAWTRFVIMSIVYGLPDEKAATARLLRNPKDFGTLLRPLYGDAITSRFVSLFTDHLVIASQLVKAAKAGDNRAAAEIEKRWYANADEIAAFLAGINPYWSQEVWRNLMHEHLRMTKAEAVDMLTGKYEESVAQYDAIEKQALQMADVMTDGILRQFPGNFL